MTGPGGVRGGEESRGVDGGLIGLEGIVQLEEVDGSSFAECYRLGPVRKDLEDPGLYARATRKACDPRKDGEPGLLNHLFRHCVDGYEGQGKPSERCAVRVDQTNECSLVAGSQAVDEVRLRWAHLRERCHCMFRTGQ